MRTQRAREKQSSRVCSLGCSPHRAAPHRIALPPRPLPAGFYTPLGNATAQCDCCGEITLAELAAVAPVVEANFTASTLPPGATIVGWARAKVGLPPAPAAA